MEGQLIKNIIKHPPCASVALMVVMEQRIRDMINKQEGIKRIGNRRWEE